MMIVSPIEMNQTTRLSAFEVLEIVVEKEIKSVTEPQALAKKQKSDLAEFTPFAVHLEKILNYLH